MKTLPLTFTKGGFSYHQEFRQGNIAIYRQTKHGQKAVHYYEVGQIRANKAREVFGKQIEASESWPSSEEWGVRAWTYPDLTSAKNKAATLIPSKSS